MSIVFKDKCKFEIKNTAVTELNSKAGLPNRKKYLLKYSQIHGMSIGCGNLI